MKEYIFKIGEGLYNDETGEVIFKPEVVGELIRCKDCKKWKDPHDYECPYHTSGDPYIDDDPEEDFYCAGGKRKDNE